MLFRICDHFKDNPKRIDKLIAIKGLPDEWLFRNTPSGPELKKPWEADVEKNIPHEIRGLCEPIYVTFRYPPIERGQPEIVEKRQILGIRIDYNSEPGRQMWDDVERYIEESTPRDERIPVPVVCARDERSSFETYTPRRNSRGSLELVPASVPLVDLTRWVSSKPVQTPTVTEVLAKSIPEPIVEAMTSSRPQNQIFKCEECDYSHPSPRGIRMHAVKRHPKKEKVTA